MILKKHYKSIDFLPIYKYFQCASGKLQYLYISQDCEDLKPHKSFYSIFEKIQEEFEKALGSDKGQEIRDTYFDILKQEAKLTILSNCFVLLAKKHDDDLALMVQQHGFRYEKNDRENSLRSLKGNLNNLFNRINSKKKGLQTEKEEAEEINLFDIISSIETSKSINIDVHTTPTSKIIAYIKELKKKAEKSTINEESHE